MSEMDKTENEDWTEEEDDSSPLTLEEAAEDACDLYQDIVEGLGVEAEVSIASIEGNDIHLKAVGNEEAGGILIGRHGQTLDAIQTLVWTIISRHTDIKIRVFLDAFGYHERREAALRQMALDVAKQVLEAGQEALTEPLSAADRRIIHNAIMEIDGVSTYSEGDEPNRYVVITPSEDEDNEPEDEVDSDANEDGDAGDEDDS